MNRSTSIAALLTSLALLLIFVAGCENTRIGDINRDPGRYAGKEVTISGRVINSYGALGEGAFELDDGSGSIWVLSAGFGVPVQGAHVRVAGRVEEGVTFGGKGYGIALRETQPRRGG